MTSQGDQMALCPALVSTMHTGVTTRVSSELHNSCITTLKTVQSWCFYPFKDCHNSDTGKVKTKLQILRPNITQYEGTASFILTKYLTRSLIYSLRCLYSNYHSPAHSALAPGATLRGAGLGFSRLFGDATSLTSLTLVLTQIEKIKMGCVLCDT